MALTEGGRTLVKMSELAKLAGVPAPTVKHYIREGLLPGPARRTSRNMAYYDAAFADRVKVIKELQQAHFLPLKLIADILEPAPSAAIRRSFDKGTREALGGLTRELLASRAVLSKQSATPGRGEGRSRAEVLESMEIGEDDLELLGKLELLEPTAGATGEPLFGGVDLELLEVIAETRARGLGDFFPVEVLGPYKEAVRGLVRMELDLFQKRVLEATSDGEQPYQEIADQAVVLGERLLVAMRARLLLNESRLLSSPKEPPKRKAKAAKGRDRRRSARRGRP